MIHLNEVNYSHYSQNTKLHYFIPSTTLYNKVC